MGCILEIENLVKKFNNKNVLNNLSVKIPQGKVVGIMGPNGNGKTTLLNCIYGFLNKDSGKIIVDGEVEQKKFKNKVSFLQDNLNFPKWMKIKDAIIAYNDFFEDFDIDKANKLIDEMNLDIELSIRTLSKGMKEKLCLSLALSRKVRIFMLDEPISGVDPVAREKILDVIIENIGNESTLLITTHYIGELERIFDEAIFILEGSVVEYGDAEELRIKYNTSIDGIYRKLFAE